MFTINQIKEANAKVKTGADFPTYIKAIQELGVERYDTFVADGHTLYFGKNNYCLSSDAKYSVLVIHSVSNVEQFKAYLKLHQQGKTDYLTFCNHAAECGIFKWTIDIFEKTCIYYDVQNTEMLVQIIPI